MADFKPSADFATRTMEDIRSYESSITRRRERMNAFLSSRPIFYLLSAAGVLLSIMNLLGLALTLLSPGLCL